MGKDQRPRASYFSVIPADVRYDDRLPPNAKLLYCELTSMCAEQGYCNATASELAEPYGLSDRTVRGLLKALEDGGYIYTDVLRDQDTGQIAGRNIYLASAFAVQFLRAIKAGNGALPSGIKLPLASGIKFPQYLNYSNNIYNPPKPPQGGTCENVEPKPKRRRGEYKAQAEVLPERFEGFWKFYRGICPGNVNPGNRQDAINAWDRLGPDEALVDIMGKALVKQSRSDAWGRGLGVPHASTWLNKHMWEDDWGGGAEAAAQDTPKADSREGDWV